MKRLGQVVAVVIGGSALWGGTAHGEIAGTKHDFRIYGWNGDGRVCIFCHTPHNANPAETTVPLWNRLTNTTTFTPYSSPTTNAVVGQPGSASLLCLSCHSGDVGLDALHSNGGSGTTYITGTALLESDLRNDHLVGIPYDDALANADGELFLPSTTPSGLGGTIATDMLVDGQVECGSCHDPHGGSGLPFFLLKSNANSALCLTCHNK